METNFAWFIQVALNSLSCFYQLICMASLWCCKKVLADHILLVCEAEIEDAESNKAGTRNNTAGANGSIVEKFYLPILSAQISIPNFTEWFINGRRGYNHKITIHRKKAETMQSPNQTAIIHKLKGWITIAHISLCLSTILRNQFIIAAVHYDRIIGPN